VCFLLPSGDVKNRLPQMNLQTMAAIFSRMIAANFMGQGTNHWNVAFAIMIGVDWEPSAMLISKKIGKRLLDKHWLNNGFSGLVCDTVSSEILAVCDHVT
jgi:hypothetical protein